MTFWQQEVYGTAHVLTLTGDVESESGLAAASGDALRALEGADDRVILLDFDSRRFNVAAVDPGVRRLVAELTDHMVSHRMPVLSCFDAEAVNAGLEVVLAADLRFASSDASVAFTAVRDGVFPACGSIQRLARLGGRPLAVRVFILGETLSLRRDPGLGMVIGRSETTARESAIEAVQALSESAPLAIEAIKIALQASQDLPLAGGMAVEADMACLLLPSADRAEGLAAMRERRPARFTGA